MAIFWGWFLFAFWGRFGGGSSCRFGWLGLAPFCFCLLVVWFFGFPVGLVAVLGWWSLLRLFWPTLPSRLLVIHCTAMALFAVNRSSHIADASYRPQPDEGKKIGAGKRNANDFKEVKERPNTEMAWAVMDTEQSRAVQMYGLLSGVVKNRALQVLKAVDNMNGLRHGGRIACGL